MITLNNANPTFLLYRTHVPSFQRLEVQNLLTEATSVVEYDTVELRNSFKVTLKGDLPDLSGSNQLLVYGGSGEMIYKELISHDLR